ncbi:hypothetical protein, partial [Staphylococcus saprophyticus]|uniref:hypothetical protein n=1 Tax=Staphylococcus saprophyticus TaxID=29385 RepID=UPI001C9305C9
TEIQALVHDIKLPKHPQQQILIKPPNQTKSYLPSPTSTFKLQLPQTLQPPQLLTQPSIHPNNYLSLSPLNPTQTYLLKQLQKLYPIQPLQ